MTQTLPFNPSYFTQGLELADDGSLLIGTGLYGESGLYRLSPGQTEPEAAVMLDDSLFGEGITQVGDTTWQLTWKAGEAIRYDADFNEVDRVSYPGQGWGLCAADDQLYLSDGTAQLRTVDPETFAETGRIPVTLNGEPVTEINELECANGAIYANVWMNTDILRIDPASGQVTAVIDASGVPNNAEPNPDNVLNGIAHIQGEEFYITGKRWPQLYRVEFVPAP